jgi:hypothetical protein
VPPRIGVRLSEFLPAPGAVDWDGNGAVDAQDEWIEITNTGPTTVDLSGWAIDTGTTRRYTFPAGTLLESGKYLVFYSSQTGLVIDDAGDKVRLIDPANQELESMRFTTATADASFSRDATDVWHADWPPSPGAANLPPGGAALKSTTLRAASPEAAAQKVIDDLAARLMEWLQAFGQ